MGFWGPVDSNVDWCEPNYVQSYYVAEWWNTVSNLPLFAMAAFGWRQARRHASGETRFWAAFCFLALVGVGSTLFHATLRYWAQLLDELPMLLCVSAFLYCLLEDRRRIQFPALPAALAAVFLALTLAYTWFNVYAIFLVGYSALLVLLIVLAIARCRRPRTSTISRVLFGAALACYGTGVAIWIAENRHCGLLVTLHLHAWWHLLSQLGSYLFIMFLLAERGPARFEAVAELDMGPLLPFVRYARRAKP